MVEPIGQLTALTELAIHNRTKWRKQIFATVGALFIRTYFKLMRLECFGQETETKLLTQRPDMIYGCWHRGFLYCANHIRDLNGAAIISQSSDGELIAIVCKRLGIQSFRGSSTRGGKEALDNLVSYIKAGHIGCMTPDGPAGPPYMSKPGIIQLAARTGAPLLAFSWDAYPSYEFNSWDRTLLPLPYAHMAVVFDHEPFYIPAGLNQEDYEEYRVEFERRMNHLAYQARYYIRNKYKAMDPRDIPIPENYLDHLPRRGPHKKGRCA